MAGNEELRYLLINELTRRIRLAIEIYRTYRHHNRLVWNAHRNESALVGPAQKCLVTDDRSASLADTNGERVGQRDLKEKVDLHEPRGQRRPRQC